MSVKAAVPALGRFGRFLIAAAVALVIALAFATNWFTDWPDWVDHMKLQMWLLTSEPGSADYYVS